jgi:hypothetical protein
VSLPQRAEPAPLSPAALLAEVARLYKELEALPWREKPSSALSARSAAYTAIEAQIRAYSERYWAFELESGDRIVGKVGGRRRPYLVLAK